MMKKLMFLILSICIAISFDIYSLIQNNISTKPTIDIVKLNTELGRINKQLDQSFLHPSVLKKNADRLEELQDRAKSCISKSVSQIKIINDILKINGVEDTTQLLQGDNKYLQEKKQFFTKKLSECRLFVYRSEEAIVTYKEAISKASAHKILRRSLPIWKADKEKLIQSLNTLDFRKLYSTITINKVSLLQLLVLLILISFGVTLSLYLRGSCRRWLSKNKTNYMSLALLVSVMSIFVVPLVSLIILYVYLTILYFSGDIGLFLMRLGLLTLVFTTFLALSKYFFNPSNDLKGLFGLPIDLGRIFHKRLSVILIWLFIGQVFIGLFDVTGLSFQVAEFVRTIYTVILVAVVFRFCVLIRKIQKIVKMGQLFSLLMLSMFSIVFAGIITLELSGFHQLSIYLITSILLTIVSVITLVFLWHLINAGYQFIDNKQQPFSRNIRHFFGIKLHKTFKEALIIRFVLYVSVICFFILAILKIWGVSPNFIDGLHELFSTGFTVAGLKIIPSRIIIALISFSVVFLLGRLIATSIARKQQFEHPKDTQIAISSIIIYFSFAIALLFALLIMGVNFTGLAIIAGALSVGVGLGLQNIVNNFVSGIILLLEKPIKPGDRVVVGATEGFVKKIRIRSTQITTLAKEDVIVPNAELIANQVTNFMFRDQYFRVVCRVGVAYGSDVNLVRDALLLVAKEHLDVVQEEPNEPRVLFSEFGENSLIFELWSIIHDVNRKYIVASDLNFAINAVFKRKNITIAFPQRDIHIKDGDKQDE